MKLLKRVLFLAVTLVPLPLAAHHSFVAFDAEREAFVRGTVSGFEFRNPHTYLYVDVAQDGGGVSAWRIESETRNDLYRNGWRDDSFQPGDEVTIRFSPARDPERRYGRLLSVGKTDGTVLPIPNEDDERGRDNIVPARSLDGVWLPIQTFPEFFAKVGPLASDRARADRAELARSGVLPRNARCIDMSIPHRLGRAHVYEIEVVSGDLILIHGEDDAQARRIHMDGREHPETIPEEDRNYTGHSIGQWEDDTLIIDTIHFKPVPAEVGPRRHLVERYRLNEDKTRVVIDFTLEDPDYLTASVSHTYEWQHSPHITRLPHSCDRESALGYLAED